MEQRIKELLARIEAQGIQGLVFKDGYFRVIVTEAVPNEPHKQMFHITVKENPT